MVKRILKRKVVVREPTELERAILEYDELKHEANDLDALLHQKEEEILEMLGDQKSASAKTGDLTVHVTRAQRTTTVIDYGKLRKRVAVGVWNRITTRVPDKAKVAQAIKAGTLDPRVLAQVSNTEPSSKPYLILRRK